MLNLKLSHIDVSPENVHLYSPLEGSRQALLLPPASAKRYPGIKNKMYEGIRISMSVLHMGNVRPWRGADMYLRVDE